MIKEISFDQILPFWQQLWKHRISPIEPMSAMVLPSKDHRYSGSGQRFYTEDLDGPIFLGAFVDVNVLVGVNSFHRVNGTSRSRGLFVLPEYRGQGIADKLLRESYRRCVCVPLWSYPKREALSVYLRAGFCLASDEIYDPIEKKFNYYVTK